MKTTKRRQHCIKKFSSLKKIDERALKMIWYKENNPEIVVSTRVRLARNIDGVSFPDTLKEKKAVTDKIKQAIFSSNSTLSTDFVDIGLETLDENEKRKLSEKHLISPEMVKRSGCGCLINKDETMSIMIMEEDHIRQQVILGGYKLDEAYELCDKVDDVLSENLNFAFDEKLGYLTACPTNIGTGMRASVMLHLPALVMTGNIRRVISLADSVSIAVRGYYGEGSDSEGSFFQISNKITTGASEKEILERVKNVTEQIISLEKQSREALVKNNERELSDKVYRAYGILKYARKISSKEALSYLSDVLLGKNMGIIKENREMSIMECIVGSAPPNIGSTFSPQERDALRAEFLRENI